MPDKEAKQILDVEDNASWEQISANYKRLYDINEKENGGSFYLQSKIYRYVCMYLCIYMYVFVHVHVYDWTETLSQSWLCKCNDTPLYE